MIDEVLNQPPPLVDYNVFSTDRALIESLESHGAPVDRSELSTLGELAGSSQAMQWARNANENPPKLRTHDRYGRRIDEVEYHPHYHALMDAGTSAGLHGCAWKSSDAFAHTMRAAKFYVWAQLEAGHGCPLSMTYAAVPVLRTAPHICTLWDPPLTRAAYEPQLLPIARKSAALCGMAMTEKQGGSDVRSNRTRARFVQTSALGDEYRIAGHKWFCSAPMSDAFLILAQADEGLTCFLTARVLPDGTRNRFFIQRLKDKLGNRSNASAEIEFDEATAVSVGEPGRGVQTIVEMVNYTRLDCMNGSAALMRQATAQAIHHATFRHAFGKALVDQPLMQCVLADLALESQAAVALLLRVARAVDFALRDPGEALLKRLGTALGKYVVCKRAPLVVGEALECLGGNGYVEESVMPRLYREAPLNSIWEGSGNVNALDVLRVLHRHPETLDAFLAEIEPVSSDARIKAFARDTAAQARDGGGDPARARLVAERITLLWQAALLSRNPRSASAEAFIDSRIAGHWGRSLGTLAPSRNLAEIVQRASPSGESGIY